MGSHSGYTHNTKTLARGIVSGDAGNSYRNPNTRINFKIQLPFEKLNSVRTHLAIQIARTLPRTPACSMLHIGQHSPRIRTLDI